MNINNLNEKVCAVVLAAGKSTRFKSQHNKLLFPVGGKPMILRVLSTLEQIGLQTTFVLGHERESVQNVISSGCQNNKKMAFCYQEQQLGTGHALGCSKSFWTCENVLVINGDMPLICAQTIKLFLGTFLSQKFDVGFTASTIASPEGYGRVISLDQFTYKIVEQKDATEEQKAVKFVNSGIYVFKKSFLEQNMEKINSLNNAKEFYLPDLINLASEQKLNVLCFEISAEQSIGVNTLQDVKIVEKILQH